MKKNIKLAFFILLILFVVLFVVKVLPVFLPIKYALKELPQNTGEYWILKGEKVTGYQWSIIGDQSGLYEGENYKYVSNINIIGNKPIYNFFSDYSSGTNKFVCYGEIVYHLSKSKPNMGTGSPVIGENVLNVNQWDIMYPINRDLLIGKLIPKNYLCRYDFYYDKHYTLREMLKGLYIWNYKTLPLPK
jgi:hypothetical protein